MSNCEFVCENCHTKIIKSEDEVKDFITNLGWKPEYTEDIDAYMGATPQEVAKLSHSPKYKKWGEVETFGFTCPICGWKNEIPGKFRSCS